MATEFQHGCSGLESVPWASVGQEDGRSKVPTLLGFDQVRDCRDCRDCRTLQ